MHRFLRLNSLSIIPIYFAGYAPHLPMIQYGAVPQLCEMVPFSKRVAPNRRLTVLAPAPNSGVLVLPTTIAPAYLARVTAASSLGT